LRRLEKTTNPHGLRAKVPLLLWSCSTTKTAPLSETKN
jgi:hypothetical protein